MHFQCLQIALSRLGHVRDSGRLSVANVSKYCVFTVLVGRLLDLLFT